MIFNLGYQGKGFLAGHKTCLHYFVAVQKYQGQSYRGTKLSILTNMPVISNHGLALYETSGFGCTVNFDFA